MIDVVIAFLVSFAFDFGRYVLIAFPAFALFWLRFGHALRGRWLRPSPPDAKGIRREILYSLRSAMIFALAGVGLYAGSKIGIFRIYHDVARHGVAYLLFSTVLLIVLQDAYFFFTHRLMHHRLFFRAVHRAHHLSRHTSPFTAYAFSSLEAVVHAAFVPIVALVLPIHDAALFMLLGFMVVRNVIGHLAIELYPPAFSRNGLLWMNTTATHHALHHLRPSTNFGLYFTFWDRMFGTTDPSYKETFDKASRGMGYSDRRGG